MGSHIVGGAVFIDPSFLRFCGLPSLNTASDHDGPRWVQRVIAEYGEPLMVDPLPSLWIECKHQVHSFPNLQVIFLQRKHQTFTIGDNFSDI